MAVVVAILARKIISGLYSGTHSYGDLVITVNLFWSKQKLSQSFSYSNNLLKHPLLWPDFCGPMVTGLTG